MEVIGTENGGFAVIAADDLMPAVLGVSTSTYSEGRNPNFEWWLQATEEAIANMVSSQAPLQVTTPDPTKYPEEIPSLVTSKWYQSEPYSNMCPVYSGDVHCLTGCVATSMAQILNYHLSTASDSAPSTIPTTTPTQDRPSLPTSRRTTTTGPTCSISIPRETTRRRKPMP